MTEDHFLFQFNVKNMSKDPEKAMEVVDDNDHESLDEDDEDGDKMEVSSKLVDSVPFLCKKVIN